MLCPNKITPSQPLRLVIVISSMLSLDLGVTVKTRKYFSIFAALMIYKRNKYEENNKIRHRYGG